MMTVAAMSGGCRLEGCESEVCDMGTGTTCSSVMQKRFAFELSQLVVLVAGRRSRPRTVAGSRVRCISRCSTAFGCSTDGDRSGVGANISGADPAGCGSSNR